MERIISYDELPYARGESIYLRMETGLRMETDPKLYISLFGKGYHIIKDIRDADEKTIYVTGKRQDTECSTVEEYKEKSHHKVESFLEERGITKPKTRRFSILKLMQHRYKLPFVLKNENQNGGREKFLIQTERDYDHLILAVNLLGQRDLGSISSDDPEKQKYYIDYDRYLEENFTVQEYIKTPTEYNTTVRLLTTPSHDLLYGSLKYNEPTEYKDDTTLLGYLLSDVYPLSTQSIVSNTLSGGHNLLIGEAHYQDFEKELLKAHNIPSEQFEKVVEAAEYTHEQCRSMLGIICGFDFIYSPEKDKWFLLEYHSRPMVGDYSKRQGFVYGTREEKMQADGRVRATALNKVLEKTR